MIPVIKLITDYADAEMPNPVFDQVQRNEVRIFEFTHGISVIMVQGLLHLDFSIQTYVRKTNRRKDFYFTLHIKHKPIRIR